MGVNRKGIILGLMAVSLAVLMMGEAYAKSESPGDAGASCDADRRLNLQIMDQNQSWQDGVTDTWVANNMAPGTSYAFVGSFAALRSNVKGGIDITCGYSVVEPEASSARPDNQQYVNLFPDEMAKQLIITSALYQNSAWRINLLTGEPSGMSSKDQRSYTDGRDFLWKANDADHDGRITFYDIKQSPLTNLPLPKSTGEGARFLMSVKFADTAGNDLQGDAFNLTLLYTFRQW